jgi:hypothetical protein
MRESDRKRSTFKLVTRSSCLIPTTVVGSLKSSATLNEALLERVTQIFVSSNISPNTVFNCNNLLELIYEVIILLPS